MCEHHIPHFWYVVNIRKSGYLDEKRARQDVQMMLDTIENTLKSNFYENPLIKDMLKLIENDVENKRMSAYEGARRLLELYQK